MSSSNENPEQFFENPSNMKSLNMDQGIDMNAGRWVLEKMNTGMDEVC